MIFSGFVAMLSVAISALLGCAVASLFVDREAARIAGFAFSIGSLSGLAHFNNAGLDQLSAAVGAITGLLLVWFLFFKEISRETGPDAKQNSVE